MKEYQMNKETAASGAAEKMPNIDDVENIGAADLGGNDEDENRFVTLEDIRDVPLEIIVELGRTELTLKEVISLNKGTTLELNKLAGEALEFLITDCVAAKGEVVVINEKYGIRLTDVVDPTSNDDS
jgi:flagellar motor switch protein FliN